MIDLLSYNFVIYSLIAALLSSITCGIIGTYIVSKRLVFISGGITHTSFGGIGLGYYLGINPILGALVFSVMSAFGIEFLAKKSDIREDSAIGMLWAFGMSVGVIFVYLTPGYAPDLMSYLFGNILTVSQTDLILMGVVGIVTLVGFISFYKTILYIAFDEEFAKIRKMPVTFVKYALLSLIALTIVVNIRVVGIILVISMLTIPQATAGVFTKNFGKMMILSSIFAFVFTIVGLILSYHYNLPSGATIIFTATACFGGVKLGKSMTS